MFGTIKVWLLVLTIGTSNPGPSPHYFNNKADCEVVRAAVLKDYSYSGDVRCIYATVYVKKK